MEVNIIKAIQSISSPFFDSFFEGVTILGEQLAYIVVFSILYWCWNKKEAAKLILVFLLSAIVNNGLKGIIMRERPIGYEGIFSIREHTATGSSFPSGHTQSTATFFYYIAYMLKKPWVTVISVIMICLVAFSRMYLGLHWLSDVIGSILVAIFMVRVGLMIFKTFDIKKLFIVLILVNIITILVVTEDLIVATAIITGAIIGLVIEHKYIDFSNKTAKFATQLVKVIFGLLIVMLIKEGVKLFTPDTYLFDYIRYMIIGLWVSAGAPYFFKKFSIFN